MSVNDFLMDFAIASLFIMIGQLIRAKVKLVQKFFVPASMIAGFLALALGSQGLNVLPFSEGISSYAGSLIIVIFAGVGISGFSFSKKNFKAEIDRMGSYFSYKVLAQAIQFAFAPLFSILDVYKRQALMRQRMGRLPPVFSRMFSMISRGSRIRFSKQPPNSSVR